MNNDYYNTDDFSDFFSVFPNQSGLSNTTSRQRCTDLYAISDDYARHCQAIQPGGTLDSPLRVSQVIRILNSLFKNEQDLQFCVRGELREPKPYSSGHFYFSLYDEDGSVIACSMWRNRIRARQIDVTSFHGGEAVIVCGNFGLYNKSGKLSLEAHDLVRCGRGTLLEELERLRQRLQAEGLFDDSIKVPLPIFPRVVGVATSASGQAIKDICKTIKDRCPHIKIVLAPCLCQGEKADLSIIKALSLLEARPDVDCIIVGRGGGSQSDLEPYNSEELVRFIAKCRKPIVSAVGHEGDTSLTDYVADVRASTPTRAAELVSAHTRAECLESLQRLNNRIFDYLSRDLFFRQDLLEKLRERLPRIIKAWLDKQWTDLGHLERQLVLLNPKHALPTKVEKLNSTHERLIKALKYLLELHESKLEKVQVDLEHAYAVYLHNQQELLNKLDLKLGAFSPEHILDRGYAIVTTADGRILNRIVENGTQLSIIIKAGCLKAEVTDNRQNIP